VYVNSDITILRLFTDDSTVGIYSIAVKIYSIIKTLLNAIFNVTLSRLSFYHATGKEQQFKVLVSKVTRGVLILTIPSIVGLSFFRKIIIEIIAGKQYLSGSTSLVFLSIALLFSLIATISGTILLIRKKESKILMSTSIGAISNVVLNFIFIPFFGMNAAALTTLFAEFTVMCINVIHSGFFTNIIIKKKDIFELIFLLVVSIVVCAVTSKFFIPLVALISSITIIIIVLFVAMLIVKDDFVILPLNKVFKIRKRELLKGINVK
jgi:O-antigen/teichoic acid export membrane protein